MNITGSLKGASFRTLEPGTGKSFMTPIHEDQIDGDPTWDNFKNYESTTKKSLWSCNYDTINT